MTNKPSVDAQLALLESNLQDVDRCLHEGDAQALSQVSEALQTTAMDLLRMTHASRAEASQTELSTKIGQLAQRLIALRENLLRRSALVDRALKVVMPTVSETTYQPPGPYGSGPRSSGMMNAMSA